MGGQAKALQAQAQALREEQAALERGEDKPPPAPSLRGSWALAFGVKPGAPL